MSIAPFGGNKYKQPCLYAINMTHYKVIHKTKSWKSDPQRPRALKLVVQVVLFVFLPLTVLVLIVAIGSTSLHQIAMRNLVGERDERAARSVASAINAQLLLRADLIQSLAIRGS